MTIKTSYDLPPVPVRSFDWSAIDDDTYDYDSQIGHGATEQEAINDLLEKLYEAGYTHTSRGKQLQQLQLQ
jgi:hypothetical protein